MKKLITSIIVFIAACTMLTACTDRIEKSIQSDDDPTGKVEGEVLVIRPEIKGQTVTIKEGETFQIAIPTIPVAGYAWKPDKLDTSILEQVGDSMTAANQDPNAAGGDVILTFKAIGKGTTSLTLIYVQTDVDAAKALYSNSFGVTIIVE